MAKVYYWLKLKRDFFGSKAMKKLRKIAGGDTYTIIYLKMQLKSLQDDGNLYYEGVEDSFIDEIALDIEEEPDNVKAAIALLIRYGLVEQVSDSQILMSTVPELIGRESESAERVRKHRAKIASESGKALQCNDFVTKCNTEKEKEKEKEIKKELEKKIKTPTVYYPNDELLNQAFSDYVAMRKQLKKPMTDRAIQLAMNNLEKLSGGDNDKSIKILEQSIMNSWLGLFELKEGSKKQSGGIDWANV